MHSHQEKKYSPWIIEFFLLVKQQFHPARSDKILGNRNFVCLATIRSGSSFFFVLAINILMHLMHYWNRFECQSSWSWEREEEDEERLQINSTNNSEKREKTGKVPQKKVNRKSGKKGFKFSFQSNKNTNFKRFLLNLRITIFPPKKAFKSIINWWKNGIFQILFLRNFMIRWKLQNPFF